MKRRLQALVFAAFMLMLAGCGSNQKADNGSGSGAAPVKTEEIQSTKSLDVENDKFIFDARPWLRVRSCHAAREGRSRGGTSPLPGHARAVGEGNGELRMKNGD